MIEYPPLFFEKLCHCSIRWIKENWVPFLSAIIIGLFSHFYAFTNKLPSFDEMSHMFGKGFSMSSGRWGLELISYIFPDVSLPWFYGLIALTVFAVSACFIVEMLHIRIKFFQILLTSSIMAFPSLTATVVFMYTLAPYAVAFLLATVAVILMQQKTKWGGFGATICMIFSLSIYQAYIALTASLLVLLLIQQILKGEKVAEVIRRGFFSLGFLIVSLGVYYLITLAINRLMGVEFNSYAQERMIFRISYIPMAVIEGYRAFYHFFTTGLCSLTPTITSRYIHILCCCLIIGLLTRWVLLRLKKDPVRIILLMVLLFLLPPAINAMYFFVNTQGDAIHTVMLYSYITVYLFAVVVLDACWDSCAISQVKLVFSKLVLNVVAISLAAIIFINVYVANATYFRLYMKYENSASFYASLMADLQTHPEFRKETPLAICGLVPEPYFYEDYFAFNYSMFGSLGLYPGGYAYDFMNYFVGIRHTDLPQFVDYDTTREIMQSQEYAEMEFWPYYGCIQMIGDTLVVKLS